MLTDILFIFMQKGVAAIALVTPYALGLYGTLLLIDFAWATIQVALNNGDGMFKTFVQKSFSYGIYYFIIKSYKEIIDQILNTFIKIGLIAGGSGISQANATNPSYIMDLGYNLMDKMYSFRDVVKAGSPPDVGVQAIVNTVISAAKGDLTIAKLFPNLFFWLVSFFIFLAFALIAIQICITWIETYFITSIAVFFIPFAVLRPTAFLAEKAIGAVIGCSAKLMMLLFVVSVSFPILESWQITGDPNTYESLKLLTCAGTIAFLCWQAPAMTVSLMSGSPSLTAGSAAGGVAAVTAMATTVIQTVKSGIDTAQKVGSGINDLANSSSNTIQAASMEGVGDSGSSVNTSPTIPQEKNNAPAGGMTAENIVSGMDSSSNSSTSGGTGESSQSSPASVASKIAANQTTPQDNK